MSTDLVAARRPLVLADLVPGIWVKDVLLVFAAAGLTGLLAQISIHLPGTPVPMTGQTLGVLVTGCALGSKRGAAGMLLYDLLGIVGLPWFAGGGHGYVGVNFGYLLGFVLAAYLCGFVAERGADRRIIGALPAMVLGEIAIYVVGVTWLSVDLHVGPGKALSLGFTPFVAGDAVKAAIGAALLPAAWKLTGRHH